MNARYALRIVALSATATTVLSPGTLHAQEPSPNVAVTDRGRPAYDPLGIRAGTFLVFPSLTVSENYDDNIFAEPDDETSDFITLLEPRVDIVSNFPRHELGLTLGSDIAFYADESDENFQDFFLEGDGELDITRQSTLGANLDVGRFHVGRDDPEDIGADEHVDYWRYAGGLTFRQEFNRLNFRLATRARRDDYQDVNGISTDERDVNVYDVLFRTGFLISPRFNTFIEGRYNRQDRDELGNDGLNRDSQGWEARLGTEVDITALLFGEAFVGFRQQFFDEDDFDTEDGISFGVDLTWNPTTLTTLALTGGADFEPTRQTGSSSNFESTIGLSIDHELLRNVLVGASAEYERDEFEEIDRIDNTIIVGASTTYLINRYLGLQGAYTFEDRSSDLANEEFTRNIFTISITAQL